MLMVAKYRDDGKPTWLSRLDLWTVALAARVTTRLSTITGVAPIRLARVTACLAPLLLPMAFLDDRAVMGIWLAMGAIFAFANLGTLHKVERLLERLGDGHLHLDDVATLAKMRRWRLVGVFGAAYFAVLDVGTGHHPWFSLAVLLVDWYPMASSLIVPFPRKRLRDRIAAGARRLAELVRSLEPRRAPLPTPAMVEDL